MNENNGFKNGASASRFRGEVLRKIYKVWLWRKWFPVFLVEIAAATLALYGLGRSVFVQRVLENALNTFFNRPLGIFYFFWTAFVNASFTAKILGILSALLLALILRHLTQGLLRLILVRSNYFGRTEETEK